MLNFFLDLQFKAMNISSTELLYKTHKNKNSKGSKDSKTDKTKFKNIGERYLNSIEIDQSHCQIYEESDLELTINMDNNNNNDNNNQHDDQNIDQYDECYNDGVMSDEATHGSNESSLCEPITTTTTDVDDLNYQADNELDVDTDYEINHITPNAGNQLSSTVLSIRYPESNLISSSLNYNGNPIDNFYDIEQGEVEDINIRDENYRIVENELN
ncbi:hypothetical protein WICMUC_001693 [Wickerhamomyces mucosus]|uniref:Uncharacterized protein n=1 Tax=Wickerhamomyces mucosus TaxID=1378264 RepID=A0A9P8PVG4_9ASCO|nr:hypothetical protein WICMUC_001693 [Wickerhamomyces mucosus]